MLIGRQVQQGYTYLLMLFAVVLVGYSLALMGETWHAEHQREVRAETDFALAAYAQALASYRLATPDGASYRPKRLEALLDDSRSGVRRRHLRRLYVDPRTGRLDWLLRTDALGIVAVCPRSAPAWCDQESGR